MNLLRLEGKGERAKFDAVVRAFPSLWAGSVLDVGCRTAQFRDALPSSTTAYYGIDLCPPASIVADLARGLPLPDECIDTVVALDVLEHVDSIHDAFHELCRVARRHVVMALPNAYDLTARIRFVRGLPPSGKYGLPVRAPVDRHRWLFDLSEARRFTRSVAELAGFQVLGEACLVGPRRGMAPVASLVRRMPNLLCQTYLSVLAR